jgi:hypothetical protein
MEVLCHEDSGGVLLMDVPRIRRVTGRSWETAVLLFITYKVKRHSTRREARSPVGYDPCEGDSNRQSDLLESDDRMLVAEILHRMTGKRQDKEEEGKRGGELGRQCRGRSRCDMT